VIYSKTADLLCEMGRFGQKTGAGWYDYKPGDRKAYPSEVVNAMIVKHSKEIGVERRTISDAEILERLVYALVNEAAYILKRRSRSGHRTSTSSTSPATASRCTAAAPCSTPTLSGFPRWSRRWSGTPRGATASSGNPAPLLAKLAAEGKTFN